MIWALILIWLIIRATRPFTSKFDVLLSRTKPMVVSLVLALGATYRYGIG